MPLKCFSFIKQLYMVTNYESWILNSEFMTEFPGKKYKWSGWTKYKPKDGSGRVCNW